MPSPNTDFTSTFGISPRRFGGLVVIVVVLMLLAFMIWQLPYYRAQAATGAAYGARMGCSCHFVEGRAAGSCSADFEPGMGMVSLSIDDAAKTATASVPLLASRTARFVPGSGCLLGD
jgi:hypothetical protein